MGSEKKPQRKHRRKKLLLKDKLFPLPVQDGIYIAGHETSRVSPLKSTFIYLRTSST